MYEYKNINQNLLSNFINQLANAIKKKHYIIITKAVEFATKKELPNASQFLISSIITKLSKNLQIQQNIKIVNFKNELESQELFKNNFKSILDDADKGLLSEEEINMIYQTYDLSKYDKKLTFEGNDYCLNSQFLLNSYYEHNKAYRKWSKIKNKKPDEFNINISHNTNKGINNQTKFIKETYKLYNNNPSTYELSKEIEQNIIKCFEEDNHMMINAISEINNIKYKIEDFKDNHKEKKIVQSFKNIKPYLNSDIPIESKFIINSWLTSIAIQYIKINPNNIPRTILAEYITTVAKATTIYKGIQDEYYFKPEQLRNAKFRQIAKFNNLNIMEITDNRRKITYSDESILFTENYIKNITNYLNKYSN